MTKSICFVTTGDIKTLATAKRALGLAVPLADLGWSVSILMEDSEENHHRVSMECDSRIQVHYFPKASMRKERRLKNKMIKDINPDYLYICAFVTRNIVGIGHRSKKLVEHSELQSGIPDIKGLRKIFCYMYEYYSIIYADVLLNASMYLDKVYKKRAKRIFCGSTKMCYFPYAFNEDVINVKNKSELDEKYTRYLDCPNFVFLGRVRSNYGAFTILDAVKRLVDDGNTNFRIFLLGSGRDYDKALKFVRDNKLTSFVVMPGFIDEEDISNYFSIASAFVSPMNDTIQDWARCPSKMYLYLPYKKPVITCRIGEPYEVLKDKGYYYTPGNSEEMASQMLKVIENKDTEVDAHAELHSWEYRAKYLNNWINLLYNK